MHCFIAFENKLDNLERIWQTQVMTKDIPGLDFNPQFRAAIELLENRKQNLFITGRAGTGKSTLLNYFQRTTAKSHVVLAPTGVAAINVGGQTIHSFFGFGPDVTEKSVKKIKNISSRSIYKKIDTIIIDEISMVRADLLDCIEKFMRLNGPDEKKPFGGVQMVFIGDLYQLPPVVSSAEKEIFKLHYQTPYFFSARSFKSMDMEFIELEKVYRQHDHEFIRLLNAIRNRSVTDHDLAVINQRLDPNFEAPKDEFYIQLTSTNDMADRINETEMAKLPGKVHKFRAIIDGDFGKEYMPTAKELRLKKGSQIMMLNNDQLGRWVNGTIGVMTGTTKDEEGNILVKARLDMGEDVLISPFTWSIYRFFIEGSQLASEVVGTFMQYPLRPAFAVTIHKSQGKTFSRVIIDLGRGTFAHGQLYVALSRCVSLEGIVLKKPVKKGHILLDWEVVKFLTQHQYKLSAKKLDHEDKLRLINSAILDKKEIEMLYLKAKDEKSRRTLKPLDVRQMEYKGHSFTGLEAFCRTRGEIRVFNVDRILEIKTL
jgi:ATP-dependent exoDNAse (exonuclease V) alpha subunit